MHVTTLPGGSKLYELDISAARRREIASQEHERKVSGAIQLLRRGHSVRAVAAEVGLNSNTVQKLSQFRRRPPAAWAKRTTGPVLLDWSTGLVLCSWCKGRDGEHTPMCEVER